MTANKLIIDQIILMQNNFLTNVAIKRLKNKNDFIANKH